MQVDVHGRRLELDERLRDAATRKVENLSKFLPSAERAEVTFSDGNGHRSPIGCELTVEGRGVVVRASASGKDPVTALDEAVERASQRLTKLKKRLVSRSRPRHGASAPSPKKALSPKKAVGPEQAATPDEA